MKPERTTYKINHHNSLAIAGLFSELLSNATYRFYLTILNSFSCKCLEISKMKYLIINLWLNYKISPVNKIRCANSNLERLAVSINAVDTTPQLHCHDKPCSPLIFCYFYVTKPRYMKRLSGIVALLIVLAMNAYAAPGDTTKVQAHNDVWLTWNGNYDTTVEFPDGSKTYRKIIMTFTLGKYQCPPTGNPPAPPQYCGDWDYTVHVDVRTKNGDTLEIARLITPYANANYPRTPWGWKQRYEYDVTGFYNQLKDSAEIRINYSGYSGGFTANIRFDMIEGTPPRNVLGIDRLWKTSSRFGDTSASAVKIEDRIDTKTLTAPANTQYSEMMFTISGHGNDDNGCSEFCKKFYEVELNNSKFDKTDIWRADCGFNHLYPQSGTWVYDRGNWCPGDVVFPNVHKLNGITGGTTYDIDIDFETYIGSNTLPNRSWGSYSMAGHVFYYGAFNKTADASLEDIIAPSDHETHFRYNPFTGRPIVSVRNTGANTITSIKFKYEMVGGSGQQEYTWTGSLAPLEKAQIELDVLKDLKKATGAKVFNVEITEVNGNTDEDATNNKLSSNFNAAMQLPSTFIVELTTNLNSVGGISETSWEIIDVVSNAVVAKRDNAAVTTTYTDTVNLRDGMYKLVVSDAGCNGLYWWANPNGGSGSLKVRRTVSPLPYSLPGYFSGDFGCGFTQYFNVIWPDAITEVASPVISVYPNPAQTNIKVSLEGLAQTEGQIQVRDMMGRVVLMQDVTAEVSDIDVSAFTNGVYTVVYTNNAGTEKLQTRVLVAR